MRRKRQAISEIEREQSAEAVKQQVLNQLQIPQSAQVAIYLSYDGELETRPLIEAGWEQGWQISIPKINGQQMAFYPYTPETKLIENRYGILEPDAEAHEAVASMNIEWIFMPLTAFDESGCRVGLGGGFYDRYLPMAKRAKSMGLAYDFQLVEACPRESFDISIDSVITPSKIVDFSPRN